MALQKIRFCSHIDLQAERAKAGLTQQQLANKAGIHVQTVKYWEGQTERECLGGLYSKAINKMADAMGLDIYLIDYAYSTDERTCAGMREALDLVWLFERPMEAHEHCDARLPNGETCKKPPLPGRRRCAQHGGLSTGAKTKDGIDRIRQAQLSRWNVLKYC